MSIQEKKPASEFSFRKILAPFLSGGALTVTRLAVGLIRIKYIAIAFGAIGVGIIAQANLLQLLGNIFVSLSMSTGMIQRMLSATKDGDHQRTARMLPTALSVHVGLGIIFLIITIFIRGKASVLIFGEPGFGGRIVMLAFSVPVSTLASGYLEAVFFGNSRYDLYVKASIWSAIIGFFTFMPLAYFSGMNGVFVAFFIASVVHFLCYLFFLRRIGPLMDLFHFGFSWKEVAELTKHSVTMLTIGAATYAVPLAIRTLIVQSYGLSQNGILQVPIALSAYYSPFITNLLWGKLHVRASQSGDHHEARSDLFRVLEFTMVTQSFIVIALMAAPSILVRSFYSKEFLEAIPLIPMQFSGDFFHFLFLGCSIYVVGVRRLKLYMGSWMTYFAVQMGVCYFTLKSMGALAVPLSHLVGSIAALLPLLLWLNGNADVKPLWGKFLRQLVACGLFVFLQSYLLYKENDPLLQIFLFLIFTALVVYQLLSRDLINVRAFFTGKLGERFFNRSNLS